MTTKNIASAQQPRDLKLKILYAVFRYTLYAVLGIALEVALYTIARTGRAIPVVKYLFQFDWQVDPRLGLDGPWHTPLEVLFGQSSLWMIPVYVLPAATIERIYNAGVFKWPWWLRAPIYGLLIMLFELTTGLALKALTGYAIWEYLDAGNVLEMTSFFILPIWMGAGMLVERIYRELMDPELRVALQDTLDNPPAPPR
ncbi:MAG: hypothetical protein IPL61_30855 [Myxococcales bacterium]|nr:hypothetical protein [Myxococcales bacterium]